MTKRWTTSILTVLLMVHPIALLRVPTISHAQNPPLNELYTTEGNRHPHISPDLLKAIARVESGECPSAVNMGDPSFGLMQVRCVPGPRGQCLNDLPQIEEWQGTTVKDLFNPEVNVRIAAQILEWNIANFGYHQGIAIYNSWSARNDPTEGPFRNQGYVDKVLKQLEAIKDEQGQQQERRERSINKDSRPSDNQTDTRQGAMLSTDEEGNSSDLSPQFSEDASPQFNEDASPIKDAIQWCRDKVAKQNYKEFRKR